METKTLAANFIEKLLQSPKKSGATVVLLEGNLGAGKTAFVKAVAERLGVAEAVTSPTFIIQKAYTLKNEVFHTLIHIDAYRFDEAVEAHILELETLFKNPHYLIFIEWPENIAPLLPQDAYRIRFVFLDENKREITFNAES